MYKRVLVLACVLTCITLPSSQKCSNPNWRANYPEEINQPPRHFGCDADSFVTGFASKEIRDSNGFQHSVIDPQSPICSPAPCADAFLPTVQCMIWDLRGQNSRVSCPVGHYLHSITIPEGVQERSLDTLREVCCAKLVSTSTRHESCRDQEIGNSAAIDQYKCSAGLYVTGLQKTDCNGLQCLTKLKCCKPSTEGAVISSEDEFVETVLYQTAQDLALLADNLGYANCHGKGSPFVGEDFKFDGTLAQSHQGFNIKFGNIKIYRGKMNYGNLKKENSEIYKIYTGIEANDGTTPSERRQKFEVTVDRSVSHTRTSEFTKTHETSLFVTYDPILFGPESTTGYTFSYEDTTSTTDSEGKVQSDTFETETTKIIPPKSTFRFRMIVYREVYSVDYTTDVCLKFSTEFQGSLRGGNGQNFHSKYQKSSANVNFPYQFGDENEAFYNALKQKSSTLEEPWLWSKLKKKYPRMEPLLDSLTTENHYCLTLTGRFIDRHSHHVVVKWENATGSMDSGNPVTETVPETTTEPVARTVIKAVKDKVTEDVTGIVTDNKRLYMKTLGKSGTYVNGANHVSAPNIIVYLTMMIVTAFNIKRSGLP